MSDGERQEATGRPGTAPTGHTHGAPGHEGIARVGAGVPAVRTVYEGRIGVVDEGVSMGVDEGGTGGVPERGTVDAGTTGPGLEFELFSSSFCGACVHTRAVLARAATLVPGASLHEYDVALAPQHAHDVGISATPTVIVRGRDHEEVFRASGVPTLAQVLVAADRVLHPRAS